MTLALPPAVLEGRRDEPLVDSVYHVIRDAIIEGRLASEQRLPQIPIADHLGISRTPVRDALMRLSQEGLVRALSWRGFAVSKSAAREILDVYSVRLPLEVAGARLALGHHTKSELAAMHENCEATAALGPDDVIEAFELNRAFHSALVAPCANPILIRMLDQLWEMPSSQRVFRGQLTIEETVQRSAKEHLGILERLSAGDREGLEAALTAHLDRAREEAEHQLTDRD